MTVTAWAFTLRAATRPLNPQPLETKSRGRRRSSIIQTLLPLTHEQTSCRLASASVQIRLTIVRQVLRGDAVQAVKSVERQPETVMKWSNGVDHSERWLLKTCTVRVMCWDKMPRGWYCIREIPIIFVVRVGSRKGRCGNCGRRSRSCRCSVVQKGMNDKDKYEQVALDRSFVDSTQRDSGR